MMVFPPAAVKRIIFSGLTEFYNIKGIFPEN